MKKSDVVLGMLVGLLAGALLFLGATTPVAADGSIPMEPVQVFNTIGHWTGVAWGDYDGDGSLDLLLAGHRLTTLYHNDGQGAFEPVWEALIPAPNAAAWGDFDGDGDVDLVLGNQDESNQIYRNDTPPGAVTPVFVQVWDDAPQELYTTSVDWGDYDDDGDLDLAFGNLGQTSQIYHNDGAGAFSLAQSLPARNTRAVAWGDYDGDGDLDLVLGNNGQADRLYRNDGGAGFTLAWESADALAARSVAWGDYDGDGDLDLAVGNSGAANQVYRNDGPSVEAGGGWTFALAWDSADTRPTKSIAWGDMDGDGGLDLVVGNGGGDDQENQVYRHDGGDQFSLAWESLDYASQGLAPADMDNDGDLDLAATNWGFPCEVYRNDSGSGLVPGWMATVGGSTQDVAWGDMDRDGDLDLAVGANGWVRFFVNDGNGAFGLLNIGVTGVQPLSLAWGDMEGDGDLDLAVGNTTYAEGYSKANVIYRNDGPGVMTPLALGTALSTTTSVAWGDMDADGDLDLAVGNDDEPNQVYSNDGSGVFTLTWEAPQGLSTQSVAWGDLDGDRDLDLAVGNVDEANQVYLNEGGGLFTPLGLGASPDQRTQSVAWGDYDGDGDLDLAMGNDGRPNQIYRNDANAAQILTPAWASADARGTTDLVWGDQDGDGDLDLVEVSGHQGILIYRNEGDGRFSPDLIEEDTFARSVAWGDYDGDGDLDLALARGPVEVYDNTRLGEDRLPDNAPAIVISAPDGTGEADYYSTPVVLDATQVPIPYTLFDPEGEPVGHVEAGYSLDGGGQWFPAVAASGTTTTNLATGQILAASQIHDPLLAITDSDTLVVDLAIPILGTVADVDLTLTITHSRDSDLEVTLQSPSGTQVLLLDGDGDGGQGFLGTTLDDQALVAIQDGTAPFTGTYKPRESLALLNGEEISGTWQLLVTDQTAAETGSLAGWGLQIKTQPAAHTFVWDTFASGLFGQSDNVVFRLDAYSQPQQGDPGAGYAYKGGNAGPHSWGPSFAASYPFRVQGTQVRVYSETISLDSAVEGALVYRLPAGQSSGGFPLADPAGQPYTTDASGFLRGRGTIGISDTLVALLPITATDSYTLYHTNATPITTGLEAHVVAQPGVQELVASAGQPLVLLNLDVALQWDARNDARFLGPFEFNLQRASELLFDWTNGQAALGRVTVYHDRLHWNDAHIRVYASNRRRPSAAQGGITSEIISDTDRLNISYAPGQVHMGAVWNRYGEPGTSLGEDWARTLAHELGHYALYLDDNYLGRDESGQIIPVDTCPGAMADPYRQDYPYDEFHPDAGWLPACQQTLSHDATGRSDWATISTYYPWLDGAGGKTGPSGLPVAVTQIAHSAPTADPAALEDPTFYLSEAGARVQPGTGARAFLFQNDWAIDLGRSTLDHILARGAAPGDQVCVYEAAAQRVGCEWVSAGDEHLEMLTFGGWQPDIVVSPVSSRTLRVLVTNIPTDGLALGAQLYPMTVPASGTIALQATDDGYSGTFHLDDPAYDGYVRVWVEGETPRREMLTDYSVGGNPVSMRGGNVSMRGGNVSMRGGNAPVTSTDGQVILFVDADAFEPDQFYTVQAVTVIPDPKPWATVVGQAYRLVASDNAPDLSGSSVNVTYMGDEVPVGGEPWLRLYYWDEADWQQLPTVLDTYYNNVSAPAQGEGLYALMSSVELPLGGPGWNLFSYPLQDAQPVMTALLSISGAYGTVYGYEMADAADPWKVYDVSVPEWVNDLDELAFGQGYWISVSKEITLYLSAGADAPAEIEAGVPSPPATFYGTVGAGPAFTPTAGMAVSAWVGDSLCGQGVLTDTDTDGLAYAVNVVADDGGLSTGCGVAGREVRLRVAGQEMMPVAGWDNSRVWELPLHPIGAANSPPTISELADQITRAGIPTGPITFTIGDLETAAGDLVVRGASSEPSLVPDDNLVLAGTGITRTLTIIPVGGLTGTAVITITVDDGIDSASSGLDLTVKAHQIYLPLVSKDGQFGP